MRYTLEIPGRPIPQPRPRVTRYGQAFTPDNGIKAWRALVAIMARREIPQPLECPVAIHATFVFVRPESHRTTKGVLSATGRRYTVPPKIDDDNLVKGLKDALQGIAFVNDSQVGRSICEKIYGTREHTIVIVEPLVIVSYC